MERPKSYAKYNCHFLGANMIGAKWTTKNSKCATKIVKIATKGNYFDQQNIIFLLSK